MEENNEQKSGIIVRLERLPELYLDELYAVAAEEFEGVRSMAARALIQEALDARRGAAGGHKKHA